MSDEPEMDEDVPEGAAVFPLIPAELNIHPLLLAMLHCVVFLEFRHRILTGGQWRVESAATRNHAQRLAARAARPSRSRAASPRAPRCSPDRTP